jgi:hypothetical protein
MGEKSDRFCALIAARQKEKNLAYADALREITWENPVLAEEYAAEVVGRKVRYEMIGPHKVAVITSEAQKELQGLVRVCMTEKGIGYRDALVIVAHEHPDLWEIARLQVLNDDISKH